MEDLLPVPLAFAAVNRTNEQCRSVLRRFGYISRSELLSLVISVQIMPGLVRPQGSPQS